MTKRWHKTSTKNTIKLEKKPHLLSFYPLMETDACWAWKVCLFCCKNRQCSTACACGRRRLTQTRPLLFSAEGPPTPCNGTVFFNGRLSSHWNHELDDKSATFNCCVSRIVPTKLQRFKIAGRKFRPRFCDVWFSVCEKERIGAPIDAGIVLNVEYLFKYVHS